MSSITPRHAGSPTPEDDPFFYGWRYVRRQRPDGSESWEQVPLTEEDVLHPQEDDFVMQNTAHTRDCHYLQGVLEHRLAGRPGAYVFCDCRIAWNLPGTYALGPDIAVFLSGVDPKKKYGTFNTARAGVLPAFVIEVVSDATRKGDLTDKVQEYYEVGVPIYVLADDPGDDPREVTLIDYRRGDGAYERMPLDDRGRVWLEPVRLWLGVEDRRLVLYDGDTGEPLRNHAEAIQEGAAARDRAQQAEERARQEAEARSAEAAARQAAEEQARKETQARQTAEKQARKEARARAAEVAARQAAEEQLRQGAAARTALEDRIRQLEDELRRSGGTP